MSIKDSAVPGAEQKGTEPAEVLGETVPQLSIYLRGEQGKIFAGLSLPLKFILFT